MRGVNGSTNKIADRPQVDSQRRADRPKWELTSLGIDGEQIAKTRLFGFDQHSAHDRVGGEGVRDFGVAAGIAIRRPNADHFGSHGGVFRDRYHVWIRLEDRTHVVHVHHLVNGTKLMILDFGSVQVTGKDGYGSGKVS